MLAKKYCVVVYTQRIQVETGFTAFTNQLYEGKNNVLTNIKTNFI